MATSVRAHITGTVWKIEVKVGDAVTEGQTVVILESMKMEMPVEAPADGKVSAILVKEGDGGARAGGAIDVHVRDEANAPLAEREGEHVVPAETRHELGGRRQRVPD